MPVSGATVEKPSEKGRKTGIKFKLSIFLASEAARESLTRPRNTARTGTECQEPSKGSFGGGAASAREEPVFDRLDNRLGHFRAFSERTARSIVIF
jgi:hypothetical protein